MFIPLSQGGYAQYYSEPQFKFIGDRKLHFHFDVDAGTLEAESDNGLGLMSRIETGYASIMADGKCRCQLRAPGFIRSAEFKG